jgi:hypothetical protein
VPKVEYHKVLEFVGKCPRALNVEGVLDAAKAMATAAKADDDEMGDIEDESAEALSKLATAALDAHMGRAQTAARALLAVDGVLGTFRVKSTKYRDGARLDADTAHRVTCKQGQVSCDCWHFVGKRLICSHIFHVARAILADPVVAVHRMLRTARFRPLGDDVGSAVHDLLGMLLVEFVGAETDWFVRRAPLPVLV